MARVSSLDYARMFPRRPPSVKSYRAPRRTGLAPAMTAVEGTGEPLGAESIVGPAGFRAQLRSLGSNSGIFFVGEATGRGLALLLVPLFTRAMSPTDYGILAVGITLTVVLTLAFSLSLDSAVLRLSFEVESEAELRRLYGTILGFVFCFSTVVTLGIDRLGATGALDIFESVPFDPYLRLCLWGAYAAAFMKLPIAVYTMRQQATKAVAIALSYSLLQLAMLIYFVVIREQGAIGALRGTLVAGVVVGAVSFVLMARLSSPRWSRKLLGQSLLLSLPLIPHSVGVWVLHLSDRLVIEPFVTTAELGLYSLAYSAGAIAVLFIFAFSKAFGPVIVSQLKDEQTAGDAPRMGTYSLAVLVFICVGVALMAAPAVRLATPSEYHGAIELIPWIALGEIGVAIYVIVSQGAWFAMRTGWITVGTLIGAAVNIGLNLLLVPPFGITAAAIAAMLGFMSLALIQGVLAHKLHPIPWEYTRWAKLLAAGGAAFAVGWIAGTEQVGWDFLIKGLAATIVYPAVLVLLRVSTHEELTWLRAQGPALRARLGRA